MAEEEAIADAKGGRTKLTCANGAAADPFDPAGLRLSQTFSGSIAVRKAITTIPVRKPGPQEFVRVHPDEQWRLETTVLELKADRETYLVAPELRVELERECIAKVLFTTISRDGSLKLWPIKLPGADGRLDEWNRSALEAAVMAQENWVRIVSNMRLGAYDAFSAAADLKEPEWPAVTFKQVLETAFRDRYLDSLDHPVLRRLRGEI